MNFTLFQIFSSYHDKCDVKVFCVITITGNLNDKKSKFTFYIYISLYVCHVMLHR